MEIPRKITDVFLSNSLYAGKVLKRETKFEDGQESIKRLIILSNENNITTLAITTTTNLSPRKHYNRDDIFIKANQEKPFECDTYIQLNRIIEVSTESLKEEYNMKKLDILGDISGLLLEEIYKVVESSELIEQKFINRIISEK